LSQTELSTTDGAIALGNLDADIRAIELELGKNPKVDRMLTLAEELATRGRYLGKLADYEKAAALTEAAVMRAPQDARAYAGRAKTRALYHRFEEAARDLDRAEALGAPKREISSERAAMLQAVGRYDEALAIRRALTQEKSDLSSLGSEASVLADMGDRDQAEKLFVDAQYHYRDVSPFPLAWLWFQEGMMWERLGRPSRARALFEAAAVRVPGYAHAISHLASLEPAERAADLLRPVVASSDDPEYEGQLGILLSQTSERAKGDELVARAKREYDALTTRHPEAFADHAARFWLGVGADPRKALVLAQKNLAARPTRDAVALSIDAAISAGDRAAACAGAERALALPHPTGPVHLLAARALDACGRTGQAEEERRIAYAPE
jgi:tetratricopeptide (TPR) repeat protein